MGGPLGDRSSAIRKCLQATKLRDYVPEDGSKNYRYYNRDSRSLSVKRLFHFNIRDVA